MLITEKFLEYIRVEKRYSANTVTSYRRDLADFTIFLMETEGMDDTLRVDRKIVRNFIISLNEKGLTNRSINRKLSSLRGYYLFLLKVGDIKVSPLEAIDSLKFYAEKQIPMSQDEMDKLQDVFEEKPDILTQAIIETLYQTGMRKSELCGLLFQDVDFGARIFKVLGKGNKQRQIPMSPDLENVLQEYLLTRKSLPDYNHLFFVNQRGKKLTEKFVYSKVNFYLSYVSSKKKKSPHMLRHSFATHVLDNGAEIFAVKEILGHASLASTQVYTNASIEQLKKVINQAHPRAKKKDEL
ncbi:MULTISPECIES: tyrosine-type recombinase/integrase [Elizabethkingia]|uniref:tyrosine-type recombinase/integrase n=1 Tax=Elizabethkingia TaxID=308865 RepID=UPI000985AF3C|nr:MULTISPECIES: tyrosine-type recombinase/integrase [Elizabethkingia]MBG0512821.1 tyrosine-type recombinase/integrase [Elizabethkingia meningoseptica]MCL1677222.1 tyrosine-type recombinase/integrase [Elizabethkingia meningoseptica]MCL1687530.1 tyrosine-type recombinase/integrase [Elizabethkingia meningoseptica]MDE5435423.1 tyrosine-type recombinase/integrase [Elizabethkingia meningoseptica]MDE5448297.1 tyrosine-type recombinase/integrase [Elizabethkingia meningoseptica]